MMLTRNIKLWISVVCLATSFAAPAPSQGPQLYLDIIDMAAISRMSPQQLEALAGGLAAEEIMRTKRSSAQALSSIAGKASSGLQSKVGLLGQASAFISSASSKSGSHDEHPGYSYEPHEEKYDYWGLKKSILYTLFQAVKAITGGVTILKGQLIKGGGALAATLGKVISVKGDAVSNLGKKIVSSAALSHKKPHSTPVYGPPPTTHVEYGPPTAYGAPTAPAHYGAPSLPTGYAAHKYPASLDGRNKLNGVHAGLVILTPLGEGVPSETLETAHSGHTPLEPPPSILKTVYSAIKNAFSSAAPSHAEPQYQPPPFEHPQYPPPQFPPQYSAPQYTAPQHTAPQHTAPSYIEDTLSYQPPPLPQPAPSFKPMTWGAVNSYGLPAAADSYTDYNPSPSLGGPYEHATSKHSASSTGPKKRLTADKIQKINNNLKKVTDYLTQQHQRSSEDFTLNDLDTYRSMLEKGQIPFLPTPVVTDNEIGVLSADLLPDPLTTTTTTTSTTISTTTSNTESPQTTESETRRKDVKYFLRGNKIVQV